MCQATVGVADNAVGGGPATSPRNRDSEHQCVCAVQTVNAY